MNKKVVELHEVETIYEGERFPAIKGISLEIGEGEFLSIIGPNGCGKTTLLETINGLLRISRGKVTIFGQDLRLNSRNLRKHIGYVPQDFISEPSVPFLVKDVVLMGRYGKIGLLKNPEKEDYEIVEEAMQLVGVEKFANRPIGKLSGGEQQKVMIARAIAQEPKLLLLDEPFSNLDVDSKREISEKICKLHEERNLTTVMVTHDILSIPKICNRIIIMRQGRIIAEEKAGSLIHKIRKIEDIMLFKG